MKKLNQTQKMKLRTIIVLTALIVPFQNCGGQFKAITVGPVANVDLSSGSSAVPTATQTPALTPNPNPSSSPIPTSPSPTTPTPAPPPPPPTPVAAVPFVGKITSFALPADYRAPYSTLSSSKHTNMAYSPLNNRLYVSGGDWVHSATDGTWSMNMVDGTWRQDIGNPVYPTLPAPHALQDGAGFYWSAKRAKFLMWPGSYFAYEPAGSPILNYSRGMWWLDPAKSTYTQELGLFGAPYLSPGNSTGNLTGGIYDEVNDHIVAFGDSSGGFACRRWDVAGLVRLPDVKFAVARVSEYPAAYFQRTMHAKIGRHVYIVGFRTNGQPTAKIPMMLRWHLDNHTMEELPAPPVNGAMMKDTEIRLGISHGKLVFPFITGPDGEIHGIYIFDPANKTWYVDNQTPSYGNFIGNSVTSLPDGRVVWSGGVFGRQQTHIWFYEAK